MSFVLSTLAISGFPGADAQVLFSDVASSRGIKPYLMPDGVTGGLAAADFDDDGDIDVFVPTAEGALDQLYRNRGNGLFDEVAVAVGLASTRRSRGALWFDYDADSRLDLLVTTDCLDTDCDEGLSLLTLYRQTASGLFSEVTEAAGLTDPDSNYTANSHRSGAVVADIDNNGYLDLIVGMWVGQARVFLNQGDGTFEDVTVACGLGGLDVGHWQPLVHDFTGDGWMDFFWAVDFFANQLWINQGAAASVPTFVDVAASAGVDRRWNEMGATIGDYDNDGDGDIYVTNIYGVFENVQRHNTLYRNGSVGGHPSFVEIAKNSGVDNGGWGWGATFFDADNDGWLDLAETNGTFLADSIYKLPMRLFMNNSGNPGQFQDVAATAGLSDIRWGSGLIAFDHDRDGDLDLMQTLNEGAIYLLSNQHSAQSTGRHYLVVRPRMSGANTRAIGARVRVSLGGMTQTRWITAGTSMGSQEPAEAFFGLGGASSADRVTVSWPGGGETVLAGVGGDQVLTVTNASIFNDGFEGGNLAQW